MEEAWLGELKPYAGEPRGSAGWRLAKAGWRLVRGSRTLLALVLLLAALWTVGGVLGFATGIRDGAQSSFAGIALLNALILLGITFLVGAIVSAVDATLDGVSLDLRDAVDEARGCARDLFWWAAVSLAVWLGLVLLIRNHAAVLFILLDVVWLILTTFVVPLIVVGGLSPLGAAAESASLLRRRWRESLNALVGIAFFTALACVPSGAVFTHAGALAHETGHGQRPLVVAGMALLFLAMGLGMATKEAFATLLVRDDFEELSPREFAGPRLSRSAKAGRTLIGIVAAVAVVGASTAITHHDSQVLRASSAPGDNYFITVSDAGGVALPAGSPVVYRERVIGEVLGSQLVAGGLRVSFHVEPGYTPSSTPGTFVVDPNGGRPRLVLTPAGEAPPTTSPPI